MAETDIPWLKYYEALAPFLTTGLSIATDAPSATTLMAPSAAASFGKNILGADQATATNMADTAGMLSMLRDPTNPMNMFSGLAGRQLAQANIDKQFNPVEQQVAAEIGTTPIPEEGLDQYFKLANLKGIDPSGTPITKELYDTIGTDPGGVTQLIVRAPELGPGVFTLTKTPTGPLLRRAMLPSKNNKLLQTIDLEAEALADNNKWLEQAMKKLGK